MHLSNITVLGLILICFEIKVVVNFYDIQNKSQFGFKQCFLAMHQNQTKTNKNEWYSLLKH